jgi:catechol 2,3-dioxygenase-like lactoylglutathione lyase family enzyme
MKTPKANRRWSACAALAVALGAFLFTAGLALAESPASPAAHRLIGTTTLINVSDLDKSVDYYSRFLGLKVAARVPMGGDSWEVLLSPDGTDTNAPLALISHGAKPIVHGTGYSRFALFVSDPAQVDEVAKQVAAAGYAIVMKPMTAQIPGGRTYRFTHFKDPDGYTVELTYFDPNHRNPATR